MNASIKITSLLCFVLALLQQTTAQCTPTTLAAAAYTNAAISNGEATTYSATNMVTYTCNSGYLSSASVALVATCNAGSPDSWSLATGTTRGSCEDILECTTTVAANQHTCHQNATCFNTPGSFYCLCDISFIGDGHATSVENALGCYAPTTTVISGTPGVKAVISSVFLTTSLAVLVL